MGGPITLPSGRMPSRIARASSAADQSPIAAGVMLGAKASKPGVDMTKRPESAWPGISPSGPRGEWQFPQAATWLTRYAPRSTELFASASSVPAHTSSSADTTPNLTMSGFQKNREGAAWNAMLRRPRRQSQAAAQAGCTCPIQETRGAPCPPLRELDADFRHELR